MLISKSTPPKTQNKVVTSSNKNIKPIVVWSTSKWTLNCGNNIIFLLTLRDWLMVSSREVRPVFDALKLRFARVLPGWEEEMIRKLPTGIAHVLRAVTMIVAFEAKRISPVYTVWNGINLVVRPTGSPITLRGESQGGSCPIWVMSIAITQILWPLVSIEERSKLKCLDLSLQDID